MLKNKLYVYNNDPQVRVPANLNFGQHILRKFTAFNDVTAIIDVSNGESITYAALAQQAVNIALSLTRYGVRKGDVIALCTEKTVDKIAVMFGAICCGAVPTALHTEGEAIIKLQVELSKPTVIICDSSKFASLGHVFRVEGCTRFVVFGRAELPDAMSFEEFLTEKAEVEDFQACEVEGWRDLAMLLYTSGSTGACKITPQTHLNLCATDFPWKGESSLITALLNLLGRPRMVAFNGPLLDSILSILGSGDTIVVCQGDQSVVQALLKYEIDETVMMPYDYLNILNHLEHTDHKLSSVKKMFSTGTRLNSEYARRLEDRFPNVQVVQFYSSSEGMAITMGGEAALDPQAIGRALTGFIIKVVDVNTGEAVGANVSGELRIKGPTVFNGYLGDSTSDVFDEEGFYKTGDIGYYDDDRNFYFVGRVKHMIKYGGYPLSPSILEGILTQHPSVSEAAVVGVPSEQFGQLPAAFLVPADGASIDVDDVINFYNSKMDLISRLHGGVRVIEKLPRLRRGKVDKMALVKMLTSSK